MGGWKQCFPLQSSHHSFDALQIFYSPFCVKSKIFPRWMMRACWNMHDQIIDFMVHLMVQTSPACFVVFNTQFDVNLKTFYIILLHTCKHTACQTKCGVMNVISFLWAAGMQNSWEGIYLCQHGRRADYCRRWGKKVRVWICQRKGGRQTSCHRPKALGTHDTWIQFNLWANSDFNRVNAFTFMVTSGLFPNGMMKLQCVYVCQGGLQGVWVDIWT